jgi:alpha-tubulin suppressor-like RCC1 family protein
VAPGGGTKADLHNLSRHLGLSYKSVLEIMNARGRGLSRRSQGGAEDGGAAAAATAAAGMAANAWSDFMSEAVGGLQEDGNKAAASAAAAAVATSKADESEAREYVLPILPRMAAPASGSTPRKKKKAKVADTADAYPYVAPGRLAQTGTLDSTVPGRTKRQLDQDYDLEEPTLLPLAEDEDDEADANPKFALIATSSTSNHSIAITTEGVAYGWGRNEANQLGLPSGACATVPLPTRLVGPWEDTALVGAATGKSHSVVVDANGQAYAVGSNKCGQCGVNTSQEDINKFRKCVLAGSKADGEEAVDVVQVSCGEQFSVLLTSRGHLYSAGLAEFGQLGNGETGEYFIAANKLGFANATKFERRAVFVQSDADVNPNNAGGGKKAEMTNIPHCGQIAIASISCGKNHTIAVEAPTTSGHVPRAFSFGCGDYGCLGHGVQADEYYPRLISTLRGPLFASNYPVRAEAGSSCSMVITQQGHVYYMGKHRQVGEATMRPSLIDALANNAHVVTACSGGAATVFCTTKNAVTVSWGKGDTGELGYGRGNQKSSAQPKFVEKLDACMVTDVACGYGHTLFLIKDDDAEDKKALKGMTKLEASQVEL